MIVFSNDTIYDFERIEVEQETDWTNNYTGNWELRGYTGRKELEVGWQLKLFDTKKEAKIYLANVMADISEKREMLIIQ